MIKVFEDFDFTKVGYYQSVLEAQSIACVVKNQFTSSITGEVPFTETVPELWVLRGTDKLRALRIIEELERDYGTKQIAWVCQACQTRIEGQFGLCWKCGASPQPA